MVIVFKKHNIINEEKKRMLGTYWSIPGRQVETSMVLRSQKRGIAKIEIRF